MANNVQMRLMAARKLLVVDDSAFARRMLRRILEQEGGFEVEEAGGGSEALEKYKTTRPDIVLLDIVMQEVGGLEVLRKLREVDASACVIMATADIQEATKQEAIAGGAAAVVNKPFRPEEVLAAVSRVLSNRKP